MEQLGARLHTALRVALKPADGWRRSLQLPGACTALRGISVAHDALLLEWSSPVDDGGSPLEAFELQLALAPEPALGSDAHAPPVWLKPVHVAAAQPPQPRPQLRVGSLSASTAYIARVRAVSAVGAGDWLELPATSVVRTCERTSGAPSAPSLTEASATALTIGWEEPADGGGSAIVAYTVHVRPHGGAWAEAKVVRLGEGSGFKAHSATVAPLLPSLAYDVAVAAVTAEGNGAFSEARTFETLPAPPPPPLRPQLDAESAAQQPLKLEWLQPLHLGVTRCKLRIPLLSSAAPFRSACKLPRAQLSSARRCPAERC
jgi:hypothetical protein